MSDAKLTALQDLIDTPKDIYKLKVYEQKLHAASTALLFDIRTIATNAHSSSKYLEELSRLIGQLRTRIDSLIDLSRRIEIRIRPGTSDKNKRIIFNNAILYDFIVFSRCWDMKATFDTIDSLIVFEDKEKIRHNAKTILSDIQTITDLLNSKENLATNVQSSEEVAGTLLLKFNEELEFAERAGALKGILKLDKPFLGRKGKYYDQLGNIVLKIVMTFDITSSTEPIAVRAIYSRLTDEYPRVRAEIQDLQKVLQTLDENGLLILKQDREGQYWVQLQPSETDTNIILNLAKEKGFIILEELVMITNWSIEEAVVEMDKFVKAGIAVKDTSYSTGIKYYFPGLSEK